MRLDHLLSKEEEVRVGYTVLLSRSSCADKTAPGGTEELAHPGRAVEGWMHRAIDSIEMERSGIEIAASVQLRKMNSNISGVDALRGHTRSHPEHDG